ncbi:1-deoxy-D-xylulose-5-phosphate reductoisomerase [Paenibacillus larvae]|uniref:1-deoxy-D-xylulose 5-phosphate reductoisomerase n=4 Tax=Paenibacillus larvae TaxID=1464 RepID=A0A2L1U1P0_9BACL|nr:1-deoxy-D-xylulose-5-phosphate reductoisomerase [Paenibacillus larvae]AQR79628.1 1-deoxy-D-xylulose-5-phosphate reductoisomerase [Paenibacillus larvae subsp. larvae]AQT86665.1 1-deoxy-D-xylulose-5-phosphate reductoisomerase [Paenibacillus larvae subsp. pulvifaciens]AQZ49255.1 1-deoxy-D-xylulose-5-phosphate reductoisomerase [Paenibacillus larvae subsp. pulvifaciens]ARF70616.1 1-deoxy-D-xylulose-5-phosphate reductoisomerase [Paenibacillus larvae subsp. pulvifaciens]AVF22509.1 1-deoxy-D-xylulo
MLTTKSISILGSTGSIGTQTLEVVENHPELFTVKALAGGRNINLLAEQARKFSPEMISVADKKLAEQIKSLVPPDTKVFYGEEGLIEAAAGTDADVTLTAVVGSQGLKPTLAAIESGKQIALANKETLVSAGHLVTEAARKHKVTLLPLDSEHSAIFQCLNGENSKDVRAITLTASGGSFRDKTRDQLQGVTVKEALNHPNWSMGAKVTIDSATMVNKGLEVIEAHWLFGVPYGQIEVMIHPESIIHSYVEFQDYSIIAQLGLPDMRIPIQYALTFPKRLPSPGKSLNLAEIGKLHFQRMDFDRFPCLRMAYECGKAGGTATTVFNAANEVAVARFLKGEISFLKIEDLIERTLNAHNPETMPSLEEITEADSWARTFASQIR